MNKNLLNKKTIYRVCCLSKNKYEVEKLSRITKVKNEIYINDFKIKGRSVYFLIDEVKKININKFYNIISAKLKFSLDEINKEKIIHFLNKIV